MVGRLFGVAIGVGILVAACSGDDGSARISGETACNDAASSLCDKIGECAPFFLTVGFTDRAQCIARFKGTCTTSFSAPGTSATPDRYAQCARDVKTAACADILGRTYPEACRPTAGTLADGAPCGTNAQCKNKLCRVPLEATCGACSSLGAAGADCERDDDCDWSLECVGKKCLAKGKEGFACSAGAPCSGTLACNAGVCAQPLGAGATCTFRQNENPCDGAKGSFCHPVTKVCTQIEAAKAGARQVGPRVSSHAAPSAAGASQVPLKPAATRHVPAAAQTTIASPTSPQAAPAFAASIWVQTLVTG